jgi:hypothetical protein
MDFLFNEDPLPPIIIIIIKIVFQIQYLRQNIYLASTDFWWEELLLTHWPQG